MTDAAVVVGTGARQRRVRPEQVLGWLLVALTLGTVTAGTVLRVAAGGGSLALAGAGEAATAAGFTVAGALVVARRPDNRIGWLFCAVGTLIGGGLALDGYAAWGLSGPEPAPGAVTALWLASWGWVPAVSLLFIWLPLLFPDGRFASRRWRVVAIAATAAGVVVAAGMATFPGPLLFVSTPQPPANPFGIAGAEALIGVPTLAGVAVGGACVVAAIVSLLLRFRRAAGDERHQLAWLLYGVVVPWAAIGALVLAPVPDALETALMDAATLAVPVTLTVAILRYRLYAIDRLVSRTVGYLVVTGLLVGVYAGAALALGQLVGGPAGEQSAPAVAGATLAVAGAFGPVRRRVQDRVDRRFDRARYDAGRLVAGFRGRVRDEADLDDLSRVLLAAVDDAVAPAAASLWLRPAPGRPGR